MRFYAERPGRAALQLLADLLVIGWVALVVVAGVTVKHFVERLENPAMSLQSAGESVRSTFADAAHTAAGIPLIGSDLAAALDRGTGAGAALTAAGRQQAETIATAALGVGIGIVALGVVPVLFVWAAIRVRYARRAGSASTARTLDLDLLALRALTHQPTHRLLAVAADPATAWRRDDPAVVRDLAALELRALGLRPP
ncbi:MAG TPA: hypothetical protein VGE11_23560 [Pseudonocardia sp.]